MHPLSYSKVKSLIVKEGLVYALMVGIGETYLVAYALHLGVSEKQAAYLGILPVILGSLGQLFALRLVRFFGSYRRLVIFFALSQGISLASMGVVQNFQSTDNVFLFLLINATIYWSFALAAGPPWNAWIAQLIKIDEQSSFLLRRNAYLQIATFVSLMSAGVILQQYEAAHGHWLFIGLFAVAGGLRFMSAFFFSLHPDAELLPETPRPFSSFPSWLKQRHILYSFLYTFLFSLGVHISSSFFAPFMLEELKLGYIEFTALLAAAFVTRSLSGYIVGALTRNHGVQMMFLCGYLMIIPLPYLWVLADSFWILICVQLFSGLAWGANEMGLTLFLMESIPHGERSRLLSWNSLVSSLGMLIGVLIGASMVIDSNPGKDTYHHIFTVSSMARILPVFLIGGFITAIKPGLVPMRILSLRPGGLGILRPIISKIKKSK